MHLRALAHVNTLENRTRSSANTLRTLSYRSGQNLMWTAAQQERPANATVFEGHGRLRCTCNTHRCTLAGQSRQRTSSIGRPDFAQGSDTYLISPNTYPPCYERILLELEEQEDNEDIFAEDISSMLQCRCIWRLLTRRSHCSTLSFDTHKVSLVAAAARRA